MTQKSVLAPCATASTLSFPGIQTLARRLLQPAREMVAVGRVLLWAVVLVAPGGFLLVPVLAASSLQGGGGVRGRVALIAARARQIAQRLQRYWTKS